MTGDQNENDALDAELENRLDELFGKDDAITPAANTGKPPDSPLADLKSSVLSIDWEISDEGLQNFSSQIKSARKSFGEDKIALMLLQIMGTLGDYIKTNRGNAHPKAFKILTSVFSGLEQAVTQADVSEIEKKQILKVELKRYNELRGLIQKSKVKAPKKPAEAAGPETGPAQAAPASPQKEPAAEVSAKDEAITAQMLTAVIKDLKEFVRAEIEALRKDLMRQI